MYTKTKIEYQKQVGDAVNLQLMMGEEGVTFKPVNQGLLAGNVHFYSSSFGAFRWQLIFGDEGHIHHFDFKFMPGKDEDYTLNKLRGSAALPQKFFSEVNFEKGVLLYGNGLMGALHHGTKLTDVREGWRGFSMPEKTLLPCIAKPALFFNIVDTNEEGAFTADDTTYFE